MRGSVLQGEHADVSLGHSCWQPECPCSASRVNSVRVAGEKGQREGWSLITGPRPWVGIKGTEMVEERGRQHRREGRPATLWITNTTASEPIRKFIVLQTTRECGLAAKSFIAAVVVFTNSTPTFKFLSDLNCLHLRGWNNVSGFPQ